MIYMTRGTTFINTSPSHKRTFLVKKMEDLNKFGLGLGLGTYLCSFLNTCSLHLLMRTDNSIELCIHGFLCIISTYFSIFHIFFMDLHFLK